jgi:hypothetical protein
VAPAGKAPTGSVPAPRALTGRAVIWLGLAAGTFATVLAVMHGIRFPGLEVVLSVAVTWLLLIIVAVTVAELLRRHHRAAARHAWRHGWRGALFAGRHTRRGARSLGGYLTRKAEIRWQARQRPTVTSTPAPTPPPAGAATGTGTPPDERKTMADTKVVDDNTQRRNSRRAQNTSAPRSAGWAQVIADTVDFEPEDDGQLLGWMGDECNGVHGYAEALIGTYEHLTKVVGLDPKAMEALHDVADAAAECAITMAQARKKFADHYELPREFAGNGGLMPHDGRWVTGEGDA